MSDQQKKDRQELIATIAFETKRTTAMKNKCEHIYGYAIIEKDFTYPQANLATSEHAILTKSDIKDFDIGESDNFEVFNYCPLCGGKFMKNPILDLIDKQNEMFPQ